MKQDFNFKKVEMLFRKADFQLECLNGSVFLDFNYTKENLIYLRRISFDRYGCCRIIKKNVICLDYNQSKGFKEEISKDNLNQEKIKVFVFELIRLNKDNIWADALEENNLI